MEPKTKKAKYNNINDDFEDYIEDKSDDELTGEKFSGQVTDVKIKDNYPVDEFGAKDYTSLKRKDDFEKLPLWVSPSGKIYLQTFNKLSKIAQDFLITIAEPVSRPAIMHVYQLTSNSLYAAVSSGVRSEDIVTYLEKFSKINLPLCIKEFILEATQNFGKANLVLRGGNFKIESCLISHLSKLINDIEIRECLVKNPDGSPIVSKEKLEEIDDNLKKVHEENDNPAMQDVVNFLNKIDDYGDEENVTDLTELSHSQNKTGAFSVEIEKGMLEKVQQRCKTLNATLLVEYDYKNDKEAKDISLDLKHTTILRPYQEKSLRRMFGNNRARSGIIVLPCGAGKTLVGVTAACTMKKSCIIFCTGGVAVEQWKQHFTNYTTIEPNKIRRFTGSHKESITGCDIFITTYSMVGNTKSRNYESRYTLQWVKEQCWGLIILDEVHTIPAETFRNVLNYVYGHCKLGLTATLVREDNKIEDLNFIVGPKLYEADWMELQDKGFIARVQCMEVRCPMTPDFYQEYLRSPAARQMLLYVMNPEKVRRCEFLMRYHEKRGDKIIIFSDNLFALKNYAKMMNKLYLEGSTSHEERMTIMDNFRKNPKVNTIFVSKLADVALDLPEANVLIQISSQGASRRQEAQRLGRITRAKKGMKPHEINAFFYSLVSSDTTEQLFSVKRQQYLKDQGYAFKIVTELEGMDQTELLLSTKSSQLDLLLQVQTAKDDENLVENTSKTTEMSTSQIKAKKQQDLNSVFSRKRRDLTGADGPVFVDTTLPGNSNK